MGIIYCFSGPPPPRRGQITAPTWRSEEREASGHPVKHQARLKRQGLSLPVGRSCQPWLFADVFHTLTSTNVQASEEKTGARDASFRVGREAICNGSWGQQKKAPHLGLSDFQAKDRLSWRKIKAVSRICANDLAKLVEWSRLPPPHLNIWFWRVTRVG